MASASGRRMLVNSLTTWGALAVNIAVGFLLTPMIKNELGEAMLGAWRLVVQVVGHSGLIQLALGAGVIRYLSRARGAGDQAGFNRFFSVALTCAIVFGCVFVLLGATLGGPLARAFEVPAESQGEFAKAMFVLSANALAAAVGAVLMFVPYSHERMELRSAVGASSEVLRGIASVLVIHAGGSIVDLAYVQLAASIYGLSCYVVIIKRVFPQVRYAPRTFDRESARELFRFGSFAFLAKLGDVGRYQLDLVVMSAFVGLVAAGLYSIALQLIRVLMLAIVSLADVTQPRLAAIAERKAFFSESVLRYSRIVSVVALGFGGCAVLSIQDFLGIWLTKQPADNPIIAQAFLVLLIGLLPDLMTSVSGMGLRAINKHSVHAVQNVFEGLANVGLSIVFAQRYGLIGVAMGTAVSGFVTKIFVQPVYCCRFFELKLSTYYWNVIAAPLLMAGSLTGGFLLASTFLDTTSYVVVAGRVVAFLVVYSLIAGFVFLRPHEREQILELARIRRAKPAQRPASES